MSNLLEQAINCDDGARAAKIIRDALGIETDDVSNYCLPQSELANGSRSACPHHRRLAAEAQFLA
jgi:hypothetical protein